MIKENWEQQKEEVRAKLSEEKRLPFIVRRKIGLAIMATNLRKYTVRG